MFGGLLLLLMMPTKAEMRLEALNAKKETLYTILQTLLDLSRKLSDPDNLNRFKTLYRSMEATRAELLKIIDNIVDVSFDVKKDFVPDYAIIRTIDEVCCYVDAAAESIAEKEGSLYRRLFPRRMLVSEKYRFQSYRK